MCYANNSSYSRIYNLKHKYGGASMLRLVVLFIVGMMIGCSIGFLFAAVFSASKRRDKAYEDLMREERKND